MYIFESVIRATSFAFLNIFVLRLRSFSRRSRSLFTIAILIDTIALSGKNVGILGIVGLVLRL